MRALERIITAPDKELEASLEAMTLEDRKRIESLVISARPGAKEFTDKLADRPDESAAVENAAKRLHGLFGKFDQKKLLVAATWLCATSGMFTAAAYPGTIPEINIQTAIVGLGAAITFGLSSNRKNN
jgi:hypothetical protein